MNNLFKVLLFLSCCCSLNRALAQVEERSRPEEWKNLVKGGRFMDLFLPVSPIGALTSDTWGTDGVKPRYIDNGIEDAEWSYWGGNIFKDEEGTFHLFVCRWREDSPKGHHEWPNSIVVHAESDNAMGPFKVVGEVGRGHNPELYKTASGQFVLYVIDGYYSSQSLAGPWEYNQFVFDPRDRPVIEGLSNLTFAMREDGSYLMVCRGGGIWFSKDGLDTFYQVSDERVYPPVAGEFEDPVVWKDNVQYHLIVNDWLGRIAFYLRSKDGIHWKTDPGEAYMPGITLYQEGTDEDWFKYERIKIFQDEYGRAIQANFAVIDTLKNEDKPNDSHSSKNIGIPLKVGYLLELLNKKPVTGRTKKIKVLVKAESGFNPFQDLDLASLRFGASEVVNFGKGSNVKSFKTKGVDLLITFNGEGNGFTADNFAGKLIGKAKDGEMIFGYSRLPWVDYNSAILSARKPEISLTSKLVKVKVENFGQVISKKSLLRLELFDGDKKVFEVSQQVGSLQPFEETILELPYYGQTPAGKPLNFRISIESRNQQPGTFEGVAEIL